MVSIKQHTDSFIFFFAAGFSLAGFEMFLDSLMTPPCKCNKKFALDDEGANSEAL